MKHPATALALSLAASVLVTVPPARAADPVSRSPSVPALYARECGACHLAYPPRLLPAASWTRLLAGLDRHFGSDATLDPRTVEQLAGWLQQHAGAIAAPPQDRITRSAWFEREHRHIEPGVWKLPAVKSAAQCAACHREAERGRFGEGSLVEPAGLSERQRRAWRD